MHPESYKICARLDFLLKFFACLIFALNSIYACFPSPSLVSPQQPGLSQAHCCRVQNTQYLLSSAATTLHPDLQIHIFSDRGDACKTTECSLVSTSMPRLPIFQPVCCTKYVPVFILTHTPASCSRAPDTRPPGWLKLWHAERSRHSSPSPASYCGVPCCWLAPASISLDGGTYDICATMRCTPAHTTGMRAAADAYATVRHRVSAVDRRPIV